MCHFHISESEPECGECVCVCLCVYSVPSPFHDNIWLWWRLNRICCSTSLHCFLPSPPCLYRLYIKDLRERGVAVTTVIWNFPHPWKWWNLEELLRWTTHLLHWQTERQHPGKRPGYRRDPDQWRHSDPSSLACRTSACCVENPGEKFLFIYFKW